MINYAKRPWKTKNKLLKFDTLCKIRKSYFVYKFLSKLRPGFEIFLATFNQTDSLIPTPAGNGNTAIITMIFDKAVIAIKKEKQYMKYIKTP